MKVFFESLAKDGVFGAFQVSFSTTQASCQNMALTTSVVNGVRFSAPPRYQHLRYVNEGAYGQVCVGINTESGKRVAIKRISHLFEDYEATKSVYREIQLLQLLHHPNIIALESLWLKEHQPDNFDIYIAMDSMDSDLHKIIYSTNKLSEQHIQFITYQMLKGLKYIHSSNVMHRDVKPSNLLINSDCTTKVADFGLSRTSPYHGDIHNSLTEYMVTRWYRSPEVMLNSRNYDEKVDSWAVGCVVAELILRRPMFPGGDYIHQIQCILDVMGVPTEQDMSWIINRQAKRYIRTLHVPPTVPFEQIFHKASDGLVDLLRGFLTFNPSNRISVAEALSHPFFYDIRDPASEIVSDDVFYADQDGYVTNAPGADDGEIPSGRMSRLKHLIEKEVEKFDGCYNTTTDVKDFTNQ